MSGPRSTSKPSSPVRMRWTPNRSVGSSAARSSACCACCSCARTCATSWPRPGVDTGDRVRQHAGARDLAAPPVSSRSPGFDRQAFVDSLDATLAGVVRTMFADLEPLPDDDDVAAPGARPEPADAAPQPHRRGNRRQGVRHQRSGGGGRPTNGGPPAARSQRAQATPARSRSATQRNNSSQPETTNPNPGHGRRNRRHCLNGCR